MNLTQRIVGAMALGLAVGGILNVLIPAGVLPETLAQGLSYYLIDGLFDTVGQIFVRSLKLMVVPLVFVSLLCGTASLGNDAKMGRLASKSIGLYMLTTGVAISLALFIALLIQPGLGIDLAVGLGI